MVTRRHCLIQILIVSVRNVRALIVDKDMDKRLSSQQQKKNISPVLASCRVYQKVAQKLGVENILLPRLIFLPHMHRLIVVA